MRGLLAIVATAAVLMGDGGNVFAVRPAECLRPNAEPSLLCAEVPTPDFDAMRAGPDGRIYIAWLER